MSKKRMLILIVCTALLLTSCGLDYRYSLDENLHNIVKEVFLEDETFSHLVYKGTKYIYAGSTGLFEVNTRDVDDLSSKYYEDDVVLSWNGNRNIGYINTYRSYTVEDPIFIYNERTGSVYFREDYNYFTDVFTIKATSAEIKWEDIFLSERPGFDFTDSTAVVIYSKQTPRIRTRLKITCVDHQWYVSLFLSESVWVASDELVNILSENDII